MNARFPCFVLLAGFCCATPLAAAGTDAVKCTVNEDRVWVYDSLSSYNVEARLKCGEQVEILGREKAYVRIRMVSGVEGYVTADSLPKPAVAPVDVADDPKTSEPLPLAQQAVAVAAAARASKSIAPVAVKQEQGRPVVEAPVAETAARLNPQPTLAQPKADSKDASEAPQPARVTVKIDVAPVASPVEAKIVTKKPSAARSKTKPTTHKTNVEVAENTSSTLPQSRLASVSPAAAPTVQNSAQPFNAPSRTQQPLPAATMRNVADTTDEDEDSEIPLDTSSLDLNLNCSSYFSAYGLSPMQYEWLANSGHKKYPGVCPAPSPAMVDFVMIFTHDVAFYNYTMPAAVHMDKNGFSDWTPMTGADTAQESTSQLDKSRREYVWVFHVKRGAYDPAKFSPRRRFQYQKIESGGHGGDRTAEDAVRFIEGAAR